MSGTIKRMRFTNDDNGRQVMRVTVDYLDGEAPNLDFSVIFKQTPVDIVIATETPSTSAQEGEAT